jgi:hypothetical protein
MALTKNQKIAAAAGCVGCLFVIFIILAVTGGIAFFAMNGGDGSRPGGAGGTPKVQPVADQPATGGQPATGQPATGQPAAGGDQVQPGSSSSDAGAAALESIRNQLTQANQIAQGQGYSPIGEPATGAIQDDTQEDVAVNLTSGGNYLMVGVCDQDCSDVDLRLIAPDGNEIEQDVLADDTPVLEFRAPATGQYRARVIMATCDQNPCAYGVALYSKP